MLKWLNILAIAYLAVAPGMSVERLVHSVNLCRFTAPAAHTQLAVEPTHHCGHDHTPTPEPRPDDCPHLETDAPLSPAIPVVQPQQVLAIALPELNPPVLDLPAPGSAGAIPEDDPRPPPGPPLVGTVILLV